MGITSNHKVIVYWLECLRNITFLEMNKEEDATSNSLGTKYVCHFIRVGLYNYQHLYMQNLQHGSSHCTKYLAYLEQNNRFEFQRHVALLLASVLPSLAQAALRDPPDSACQVCREPR